MSERFESKRCIFIQRLVSKRSDMDHTVLPYINNLPFFFIFTSTIKSNQKITSAERIY